MCENSNEQTHFTRIKISRNKTDEWNVLVFVCVCEREENFYYYTLHLLMSLQMFKNVFKFIADLTHCAFTCFAFLLLLFSRE